MKNIIIDTDPGHDDALAIMLAVKSGFFNILALTTVAGNSTIENVTRNASYILELLGKKDIPVYSGEKNPLNRELIQAVVHGSSGLDGVDTSTVNFSVNHDAVEEIIQLVHKHAGDITLLTLGPLSNIARAFQKDSSLPSKINQIVMMGGAIDVPGNKNRVAEFNMFVDPEAADIVFKTDTPKVLIPIDICNTLPMFLTDFEKLQGSTLYDPIMAMMKQFIAGIEKFEGTKGALVYDAIAAYYLINPDAYVLEPMDVVMETKGEHTFGMTVAEKRIAEKKKVSMEVARQVDRNAFVSDFLRIVKG